MLQDSGGILTAVVSAVSSANISINFFSTASALPTVALAYFIAQKHVSGPDKEPYIGCNGRHSGGRSVEGDPWRRSVEEIGGWKSVDGSR